MLGMDIGNLPLHSLTMSVFKSRLCFIMEVRVEVISKSDLCLDVFSGVRSNLYAEIKIEVLEDSFGPIIDHCNSWRQCGIKCLVGCNHRSRPKWSVRI